MRFLSETASRERMAGYGYEPDRSGRATVLSAPAPGRGSSVSKTLDFDLKFGQTFAFARMMVQTLPEFDECLLWVTQCGVWSSCENPHLYYRLRQSYGELTLLGESPGHLFLGYEGADLISYIQLAILFGWDFHVLPSPDYVALFVSHDEYIVVNATDTGMLDETVAELSPFCKKRNPEP